MKRLFFTLGLVFISIYTFSQTYVPSDILYAISENTTVNGEKLVKTDSDISEDEEYKHWTVGLDLGYGFRMAPIPKEFSGDILSHKKRLKHGVNLGLSTYYYFSKNFGLGCRYNMFNTKNSMENMSYTHLDEDYIFEYRQDNIYLHFLGPSVALRAGGNKTFANFDFSIGYLQYINYLDIEDESLTLKKSNFSFMTTIGTDFMVSNSMSLGLNLNISAVSINTDKLIHQTNENFSRVSLGLIIKYHN